MWQKKIKKAIFTLNIDNYEPEICEITYPLIKAYAYKIQADFNVITERKFPGWPVVYEKFQIYELAQQMENDWNIYIDSDALIRPDVCDFTSILPKDTVSHHGMDFASIRWRYDRFFLRDGRNIGSGNWFTLASDWCIELWKPLDDLTFEDALKNIYPSVEELASGIIKPEHLIDDYTCSRNIAKHGFKFQTIRDLMTKIGFPGGGPFFYHAYTVPTEAKLAKMKEVLKSWGMSK